MTGAEGESNRFALFHVKRAPDIPVPLFGADWDENFIRIKTGGL